MNFTPGPWEIRPSFAGSQYLHIKSPTSDSVACTESEADARLIAAAPDLLYALKSLMDSESRARIMPIGAEWDVARAAIAKATEGR